MSLTQTEKRGAKGLLEAKLAEQGLVDYNSEEKKTSENQVAASILTEALQARGGSSYNDTLSEVDRFLDERMAPSDDLLQWWKVKQNAYPSLAKLARNYLAIPATSVPSESVFSHARHELDGKDRLDDDAFCAKMEARSWLKFLQN